MFEQRTWTAKAAVAAISLNLMAPAGAAESPKWYVGASSDTTQVEVYRGLGWEMGGEQPGLSLRGGVELNRHFAVEMALLKANALEWTEYYSDLPDYLTTTTTFDVRAASLAGIASMHFADIFEAYFKAGLTTYHASGMQKLDDVLGDTSLTRSASNSGSGYLLGLGLGADVTPKWSVRIEYQFFSIDRSFLGVSSGNDPTVDTFAMGVVYRLGNR